MTKPKKGGFPCPFCSRVFDTGAELIFHMQLQHPGR